MKVIYYGLPHRLCSDEKCATLWGFACFITILLPFNGIFFVYPGNYFIALWRWFTTPPKF